MLGDAPAAEDVNGEDDTVVKKKKKKKRREEGAEVQNDGIGPSVEETVPVKTKRKKKRQVTFDADNAAV